MVAKERKGMIGKRLSLNSLVQYVIRLAKVAEVEYDIDISDRDVKEVKNVREIICFVLC